MVFLLKDLLDRFFLLKADENKPSSFVRLRIHWKLNSLNLEEEKEVNLLNPTLHNLPQSHPNMPVLVLYLSECTKILANLLLCCLRVQTTDKYFLDRLLLQRHGFLWVNLSSIQPVLLLCQHLRQEEQYEDWQQALEQTRAKSGEHYQSTKTYFFYTCCIFEQNEPKSSWTSSVWIHFNGAVCHLTKFREVIFEILFTSIPAEAPNKHFPRGIKYAYLKLTLQQ